MRRIGLIIKSIDFEFSSFELTCFAKRSVLHYDVCRQRPMLRNLCFWRLFWIGRRSPKTFVSSQLLHFPMQFISYVSGFQLQSVYFQCWSKQYHSADGSAYRRIRSYWNQVKRTSSDWQLCDICFCLPCCKAFHERNEAMWFRNISLVLQFGAIKKWPKHVDNEVSTPETNLICVWESEKKFVRTIPRNQKIVSKNGNRKNLFESSHRNRDWNWFVTSLNFH